MPSASRSTTPVAIVLDVVEGRYAELEDQTVSFETFTQDLDVAPDGCAGTGPTPTTRSDGSSDDA